MAELQEATREHLRKAHTRQILEWLRLARVFQPGTGYAPWGYEEIPISVLKAELATREHIPNKLEAKAIRQARHRNRH